MTVAPDEKKNLAPSLARRPKRGQPPTRLEETGRGGRAPRAKSAHGPEHGRANSAEQGRLR
eukprot:7605452-Pyramimonas_sp.AAC.1